MLTRPWLGCRASGDSNKHLYDLATSRLLAQGTNDTLLGSWRQVTYSAAGSEPEQLFTQETLKVIVPKGQAHFATNSKFRCCLLMLVQ